MLVDQSKDEPVPVIGEIKAKTDRDLSLALIQSLMYAVELSSQSHITRLENVYGGHIENITKDSKVDIYLLFQEESSSVGLYDETLEIARQLFSYEGKMTTFLRSIKFVHVKLGSDTTVTFTVEDVVSSMP